MRVHHCERISCPSRFFLIDPICTFLKKGPFFQLLDRIYFSALTRGRLCIMLAAGDCNN
jgi:hypothetical protein